MKARVVKRGDGYKVEISHAHQGFHLDYKGPRDECRWMARMFRIALKAHNEELLKKRIK
jgi:hypothetical protein